MFVDKVRPKDERVNYGYAEVNGKKWHYLYASPMSGKERGTIVLVHGFPDISLAWRYQIPMLLSLNFRCVAIDCMGYGGTGSSNRLSDFSLKTHADAIAGIAKHLGTSKIILGGHDWGGLVVYRTAQWYPDLVTHVFSVATPYWSPQDEYVSTEALVNGPLPQFGYQLQFGSEDNKIENVVKGEKMIRKFLKGIYGGKPRSGKSFMSPEKGIDLELLQSDEFDMTPLLNEEELDFYVAEFTKNGMNGPCNWYRTRKINWEEEKSMPAANRKGLSQPTLFIQALGDNILIPSMSRGMEERIPNLTRGEVKASHWALWHTPQETNDLIKKWIEGVVLGEKSKI
ncbi:hypothetical protein M433DRAFT_147658 [Acidomyces richmondensis BFW]|nr:MAG: hypothetical protein FE78DRAFT_280213 [Acidomyces sp. 'richmondensis']KYG41450.1 hypothetical protein M433DRAFT_147658 [Acidomyces richmondensis BFW]